MSDFIFSLYTPPSFLDGIARTLDFSGSLNMYNISRSHDEADIKALRSDWEAIGKDMWNAIELEKTEPATQE